MGLTKTKDRRLGIEKLRLNTSRDYQRVTTGDQVVVVFIGFWDREENAGFLLMIGGYKLSITLQGILI